MVRHKKHTIGGGVTSISSRVRKRDSENSAIPSHIPISSPIEYLGSEIRTADEFTLVGRFANCI